MMLTLDVGTRSRMLVAWIIDVGAAAFERFKGMIVWHLGNFIIL